MKNLKIKDVLKLLSFLQTDGTDGLYEKFIGKKVIVRTYADGVYFGELIERAGNEALLKNVRNIHYWKGAFTLNEISETGVGEGSRLSIAKDFRLTKGVVAIIPCSKKAIENLTNFKSYEI